MITVSSIESGAGSVLVSERPPSRARDPGNLLDGPVAHLHQLQRLADRDAGHRRRYVEKRSLAERRHELRSQVHEYRYGGDDERPAPPITHHFHRSDQRTIALYCTITRSSVSAVRTAGARHERTLFAVACSRLLGPAPARDGLEKRF